MMRPAKGMSEAKIDLESGLHDQSSCDPGIKPIQRLITNKVCFTTGNRLHLLVHLIKAGIARLQTKD
jgi:hypothetical protein